ncbi:MAG: PAS domain S-box protein [Chloroflexota bacterium]
MSVIPAPSTPQAALQALLESMTDYVFTVSLEDRQAVRTTHSPGVQAVTGYTPAEYQANPGLWLQMVHPHDRALVEEQARQVSAGERPAPIEHRLYHKDGTLHWVRNTSAPRFGEDGRLVGYDGLITDITSRKQAEQTIREREELYRALFEAAADAILIETTDGRILDCNAAACRMFGWGKDELPSLSVTDLVPPEMASHIPSLLRKLQRSGEAYAEVVNRTRDGRRFPCELRLRAIKINGEKRVIAYVHDLSAVKRAEEAHLRQMEAEARTRSAEAARAELAHEVQERKRAEAELRESEERFRTTFEQAAVGISLVDLDGRFLRVNPSFCEIVGYTPGELLGLTFQQITHPHDLAADLQQMKQLLDGRSQAFTMEKRYLHKLGHPVWIQLTVALLRGGDRRPKYFISVVQDISDRKRMDAALLLNDTRLEALLRLGEMQVGSEDELIEYALEEVVRLTRSQVGYLHFVNPDQNSLELYRWSKGTLQACQVERQEHYPLDQAGVWADCVRLRRPVIHNDYPQMEDRKGCPPGHFPVQRHMSAPLMDGDQVAAVVGVGNKIEPYDESDARQLTLFMQGMWALLRRHQAEQALQAAHDQLRELDFIINHSDTVALLCRMEPDWPVEYISDSIAQYGYLPVDFVDGGLSLGDIILDEDRPKLADELKRCISRECSEFVLELRLRARNGAVRWVSGHGWVRQDTQGQVTHIQGITIDITERKRMEEYMLRTERLTAMGYMSAVLAHEVKNPLQAIRSHLELMLQFELEAAEQQEYLRFCCNEIDRLAEITGRVLGFAHPGQPAQAGQGQRPVPVSLAALVDQALSLSGDALRRARVQVEKLIPHDLPPVLVVPNQVTQALLNLTLNAAEAATPGGWLKISAGVEAGMAVLSLSNDGPPIENEHLAHLFDPFFTTKPDGVGLGLYVSYSAIQQQGGVLTVENRADGGGVVFRLCLPLALVDGETSEQVQP